MSSSSEEVKQDSVNLSKAEDEDEGKFKHFENLPLKVIKNHDSTLHSVYKAIYCLVHLSEDWKVVKRLYKKDIVAELKKLLSMDEPQLVRAIARLIFFIL